MEWGPYFSSVLLASALLGAAGAWIVGKFGVRLGLVDKPGQRSSHQVPTPKGGGIGILAAFLLVSWLLRIPPAFWLPAASVSLVSLVGDRVEISPQLRLPIHFLAAFAFLLGWERFRLWPLPDMMLFLFLSIFIVGTANFYNFMDGINGIASITGMVAFALLGLWGVLQGFAPADSILAFSISLSCLGFLPFNMPKARVFLGDVGSLLLGFLFSQLVVSFTRAIPDFVLLSAFLFPFYLDELTTMAVRLRDRENLFCPHRRHIYQLLANQGRIPHWKVSTGFGLYQLGVGTSLLLLQRQGQIAMWLLLSAWIVASGLASIAIRDRFEGSIQSAAH